MRLPELPLLKRELVALLRTRKAFWIVVLSLLLSSLIPLLAWPNEQTQFRAGMYNIWTFNLFFLTQLTVALFIIPAFTAGAIAGERERDTYDALYSTLLRPTSIILSKIIASTGFVLIVLVCTSPAVFVLYLLGGMSFESILKCYAVTLAAMISASLISLSQSMNSRRTAQAGQRAVFWVLFWNLGLLFLCYVFFGFLAVFNTRSNGFPVELQILATITICASPFPPIITEILSPGMPASINGRFLGGSSWLGPCSMYIGFAATLSLVHFLLLLRRARTPEHFIPTRRERKLARMAPRPQQVRRSTFSELLLRLGEAGTTLARNPVFLKELRSEYFGKLLFRRITFWLPLALFSLISVLGLAPREKVVIISCTALTLLALLVPAVAASSIPREIEQGNLDFLRGTSLTWGEIVAGKLLASVYSCWGILASGCWVILGLTAWALAWGGSHSEHAASLGLLSCLILAMSLLYVAALGTLASSLAVKTMSAQLLAYAFLFAIFIGWPIVAVLGMRHADHGQQVLTVTNPFVALVQSAESSRVPWESTVFGFLTAHAIAAAFLLALARKNLSRTRTRDP